MNYINFAAVILLSSCIAVGQPGTNEIVFINGSLAVNTQIYTIGANGSGQVNISNDPGGPYSDPQWSPDGSRILHTRNGHIWVMNADGTGDVQLTFGDDGGRSCPVWSPSGSEIAFILYLGPDYGANVVIMDLKTGQTRNLIHIAPKNFDFAMYSGLFSIDWSPDGGKIAFSRWDWDHWRMDIHVINTDGTGEAALTNAAPGELNIGAEWSPDGTKIAYSNEGDRLVRPTVIRIMNADGSNDFEVTNDFMRDDYSPSWSPDGTKLAFSGFSHATTRSQIYVVDILNFDVVQLTQNEFYSAAPDWRPIADLKKWTRFDYDGDAKSDFSVFRPSDGTWYLALTESASMYVQPWGVATDKIAPADYDGDGKTDMCVYRPNEGNLGQGKWYVIYSQTLTIDAIPFGLNGDVPLPQDFDGDGKADFGIWRPSDGTWYLALTESGIMYVQPFGLNGDKPVPADFDGDGRSELAVWRPSEGRWYVANLATGSFGPFDWGLNGDMPVVGDFSGDGKADYAVYRPSNQTWYRQHTDTFAVVEKQFGLAGDIPAPGDFDGDGKLDIAVYRPSEGRWYVWTATNMLLSQQFGVNGDIPTESAFVF